MESRQRVVMTLSVPPDMAQEYKQIAQARGASISQLFREIFAFYKQEQLKEEFYELQRYGVTKAKKMKLTEETIEQLIFEGR